MGRVGAGIRMAATVLAICAGTAAAAAGPELCSNLAARLDQLDGPAFGDTDPELNSNILERRQELDLAMVEARRSGCVGSFFRQRPRTNCGVLMPAISRMQANLSRLTAQLHYGAIERRQIVRQLAANDCDGLYDAYPQRARPGLFASLFGDPAPAPGNGSADAYDPSDREDSFLRIEGYPDTFRTLCVRTCDGYYFPISFSTVPARFGDDMRACSAMCPGTEVSLYVHHSQGEGAEQMVSLSGQRYTALPMAFSYRKSYNPTCACHTQTAGAAAYTPSPSLGTFGAAAAPKSVAGLREPKKNVRIVGPSYYVAQ